MKIVKIKYNFCKNIKDEKNDKIYFLFLFVVFQSWLTNTWKMSDVLNTDLPEDQNREYWPNE